MKCIIHEKEGFKYGTKIFLTVSKIKNKNYIKLYFV